MNCNFYTFRPHSGVSWVLFSGSLEAAFVTTCKPLPIPFLPEWTNGYIYSAQLPRGDCGLPAFLFYRGYSVYLSYASSATFPWCYYCKVSNRWVFNYKVRARGLKGDWDLMGPNSNIVDAGCIHYFLLFSGDQHHHCGMTLYIWKYKKLVLLGFSMHRDFIFIIMKT